MTSPLHHGERVASLTYVRCLCDHAETRLSLLYVVVMSDEGLLSRIVKQQDSYRVPLEFGLLRTPLSAVYPVTSHHCDLVSCMYSTEDLL